MARPGDDREPRTRIVPPAVVGDGDGLDVYRVDTYTPPIDLAPGTALLVITRGPTAGSYVQLGEAPLELGRIGGRLILNDSTVSRRHAVVERRGDGFWIRDLKSLNGVHVNDSMVAEHRLRPGDQIQIGLFKLSYVEAPAAST